MNSTATDTPTDTPVAFVRVVQTRPYDVRSGMTVVIRTRDGKTFRGLVGYTGVTVITLVPTEDRGAVTVQKSSIRYVLVRVA